MKFFMALVPPDDYKQRVVTFQRQQPGQTLTDLIEPHITIKAQGGLTPDLQWLADVNAVCAETAPFDVQLGAPDGFGEQVVFLSVQSDGARALHDRLLAAVQPSDELIRQYFEGKDWHAHLTLGTQGHGLSAEALSTMKLRAAEELQPYPAFTASFVRLYRLDTQRNRYVKVLDIPLCGKSVT